jgi:hypothetical protein
MSAAQYDAPAAGCTAVTRLSLHALIEAPRAHSNYIPRINTRKYSSEQRTVRQSTLSWNAAKSSGVHPRRPPRRVVGRARIEQQLRAVRVPAGHRHVQRRAACAAPHATRRGHARTRAAHAGGQRTYIRARVGQAATVGGQQAAHTLAVARVRRAVQRVSPARVRASVRAPWLSSTDSASAAPCIAAVCSAASRLSTRV